jgi:hypothetical protein
MPYRITGLTSLHDVMGDWIVYRNLVPADRRLPAIDALRGPLDLEPALNRAGKPALSLAKEILRFAQNDKEGPALPRKAEPAYGRVVAEMLRCARALDLPGATVRRLIYIGDTRLNDGTAFDNLCAAGSWPGWAFIGRDDMRSPAQVQVEGRLYLANRWSALPDFVDFVEEKGFPLDEGTAAVIDVDKTAIGARGRNDQAIDQARVEGIQHTVADLLGPSFDQAAFQGAYDALNQPAYHAFTADNQDYLAYICLMLGAGLFELAALIAEVQGGSLHSFGDFIAGVQARRAELAPTGLTPIHDDVWRRVQVGDPTPFKAFRYNEYLATAARFGDMPGASPEQVLAGRIVLTAEVRQAADALRERGAVVFGVSDKPDEASLPNEEQARAGMQPLHRLQTLAVSAI